MALAGIPGAGAGDCFVVEGGRPIEGAVSASGNKNEALPVLAATLLAPGGCALSNLPRIDDVATQLQLLRGLGVRVQAEADGRELRVDSSALCESAPDDELGRKIRGSFLLAPGLLHRTGRALLPRPGGDRIGRRRIDTHLHALQLLGAEVVRRERHYELRLSGRFRGGDIFLDEASVMATENALMAAAVAEGRTRIANAASEPHVQGLCRFLNAAGARIRGIGSNLLEIEGVPELSPAAHSIGPDHIEVGSFVAIAALTGGELRVRGVAADDLRMILMVFARLGVEVRIAKGELLVPGKQELTVRDDLDGAIPTIGDSPWPGFPTDLSSIALVLATQARGTVLIHEKMFENRLFFVDRLIAMGARVVLCDPHRAVVSGPTQLHGDAISSPDIRAGMALLAAALCAKGRSVIMNAHQVDRGYERMDERLRRLGASIARV